MRYWLVMPAAGCGRRFGGSKQYASLGPSTVIEQALRPFLADPRCLGGSIALGADDAHAEQLRALLPERYALAEGGEERAHSVRRALAALQSRAAAEDWVLVHDAARPCLSDEDLSRLLEAVTAHPVGGLLAVRVVDTLKRCTQEGAQDRAPARHHAAETLARDSLWLAQTPQAFRYAALCAALERALEAGRTPTDEAQAIEWAGARPLLVEALEANIKITGPADLRLAEAILSARRP